MCSDRLDTDFPDIDLSQLDTSDFDSVNCLSELQWCNDQPVDSSPASIRYSTTDELFEVRASGQTPDVTMGGATRLLKTVLYRTLPPTPTVPQSHWCWSVLNSS